MADDGIEIPAALVERLGSQPPPGPGFGPGAALRPVTDRLRNTGLGRAWEGFRQKARPA